MSMSGGMIASSERRGPGGATVWSASVTADALASGSNRTPGRGRPGGGVADPGADVAEDGVADGVAVEPLGDPLGAATVVASEPGWAQEVTARALSRTRDAPRAPLRTPVPHPVPTHDDLRREG